MSSSNAAGFRSSSQLTSSSRRPLSIAELADRALNNPWDPTRGLKQWLKAADGFRKAGRAYVDAGELEAAFVEYAKAATIILEKLPTHKEYYTLLSATQRYNLGLVSVTNGQAILESLGELKPVLVDRYERWASQNPEEAARIRTAMEQSSRRSDEYQNSRYSAQDESGWQAQEAARRDSERRREEERRRDEYRYRPVDPTTLSDPSSRMQVDAKSRKKEDTIATARRVANISSGENSFNRQDWASPEPLTRVSSEEGRREHDDPRKQEDLWKREEEDAARRRPREHQGIVRRQQEAEAASRIARHNFNPPAAHVAGPSTLTPHRLMIEEPRYEDVVPLAMPLESPTRLALPLHFRKYTDGITEPR
ncbi:hypothetical protein ID866_2915 [Astraeus odoratus]|nr:hypothetical protein ID866_2915 [Astraeus odoratus]